MQVQVRLLPDDANAKRICLLPGNRRDKIIIDWRPSASLYHTAPIFTSACLETVVLSITYHGHRHHYGASNIPADENR